MRTAIGFVTAQSLRAGCASGVNNALRLTSRVRLASRRAPLAAASFTVSRRAFAMTRPARASAKTAARLVGKPPAKATKGTKTAKKATPKKPAKKAAPPKKPTRKVLTKEEKTKLEIRELKKIALLDGPAKRLPDKSWVVYVSQKINGNHLDSGSLGETMKELSGEFKQLPESERERLRTTAKQNHLANQASYRSWVESHDPAVIAEANRARARLSRIYKPIPLIKDLRQPKQPIKPFSFYVKSRYQSGDVSGEGAAKAVVTLAGEWKNLSDAERKPYYDSWNADMDRYVAETKSILGKDVKKAATAP